MRLPKKMPRVVGVPLTPESVINLGKGVKDSLLNRKVNDNERLRRLNICHSCEHYNNPRCKLCGCYMNFKTTLLSSTCPIKKWSIAHSELSINHTCHTKGNK